MPPKFIFRDGETYFECDLRCATCSATTKSGRRCKNRVCIGLPECWQHTFANRYLRVKESNLPFAGKGLFALSKTDQGVLFRKNQIVCAYNGQHVSRQELDRRYNDFTAPYGLCGYGNKTCEDAACERGLGSLANGTLNHRQANIEYRIRGGKLCLIATKNIQNGQELLAYYGSEYGPLAMTNYHTRK